jgi:hypothetical protein
MNLVQWFKTLLERKRHVGFILVQCKHLCEWTLLLALGTEHPMRFRVMFVKKTRIAIPLGIKRERYVTRLLGST